MTSHGTVWVVGGALSSFDGSSWTLRADDAIAIDMLDNRTIVYLDSTGGVHTIGL